MMKSSSIHFRTQRNKQNKFLKRWKNLNISVFNLTISETSIRKCRREFPIFISSLWILQILSQHINGHCNSMLICSKEPLRRPFLAKKIDAKTSSTCSKSFSMNLFADPCYKKINLFSHS